MQAKEKKASYYLFLIPAFLIFLVFIFGPMIYSFVLSLFEYNMMTIKEPKFIGFDNFTTLFNTPVFGTIMKNTAVYTLFTVPLSMMCGLGIALLINNKLIVHKNFYKACYYIPYVSSMVAVAIVFSLLFNASTNGIINQILISLGLKPVGWLSDARWAMPIVILLSVWKDLGYVMVIYTGGILAISQDIYEAASLDPISPWKKLTKITPAAAAAHHSLSAGDSDHQQLSGLHAGAGHDQRRPGVQHHHHSHLPLSEGL